MNAMSQLKPPGGPTKTGRGGGPRRDGALDGVRGLAALAVMLSHVAAMTWIPFEDRVPAPDAWRYALWHLGAPAVDVFFVLSGYVVARSILARRGSYAAYVAGRYARLLPIAWCGVFAGLLLRAVVDVIPAGMSHGIGHILEHLDKRDIVGFATMTWPIPAVDRVDGQLWSMFVETQAALFLPVAVAMARRSAAAYVAVSVLLLAGLTLATGSVYPVYFLGIAVGAGYALRERSVPAPPRPMALLAAGGAVLLVRHWTGSDDAVYRIVGAFGALGVVIAVRAGAGRAILAGSVCRWLGGISYPLYAIHVPVMIGGCVLLSSRLGVTGAAVASMPFALLAAEALRIAVDRPAIALSRIVRT